MKSRSEKWRPKHKWIKTITIDLKEPKKTKYTYHVPKTREEEKRMEDDFNIKIETIFDIIIPEILKREVEKFGRNKK